MTHYATFCISKSAFLFTNRKLLSQIIRTKSSFLYVLLIKSCTLIQPFIYILF